MKKIISALCMLLILVCTGCQYLPKDVSGSDQESAFGGESSILESSEVPNSSENDEKEDVDVNLPIEGQNFLKTEGFTFMPSVASDLFVEEFKADFLKSQYHQEGKEYAGFYNYMPEEIANQYHIHAFEVVFAEEDALLGDSGYYLWYEGYIARVDSIGAAADGEKGFTHFALEDINKDGFFELFASYSQKRNTAHFTYATVLDSRSKTHLKTSTIYKKYAYFKFDENGRLGLYETAQKGIENAASLYTEFIENEAEYQFANKEVFLQSENYDVKVTIQQEQIHFPVQFKNADPYFTVTAEMTYKGETFTYVNGDTYLEGAAVAFKDGEKQVSMEGWGAGTAITTFTIKTGDVITRTYTYYDSYTKGNEEGIYDMVISYRGEEIMVEDFLEIRRG